MIVCKINIKRTIAFFYTGSNWFTLEIGKKKKKTTHTSAMKHLAIILTEILLNIGGKC